ncbi:MAG: right-handed parallel beta-helix repeat-containing protein [Promethearchaeota archaeon]
MSDQSKGVIIMALLVGVAGMGLGVYSTFFKAAEPGPQGLPGADGTDGTDGINGTDGVDGVNASGYYCSSEAEINAALVDIGTGEGRIVITEDITLTSQLYINQDGSYIIEGESLGITLTSGNFITFNIAIVESLILRDLTIDASAVTGTTSVINVDDSNISIERVRITGSGVGGRGVYIIDPDVSVENCEIDGLSYGIWSLSSGDNVNILNNHISNCDVHGIYFLGQYVICSGNSIEGTDNGIYAGSTSDSSVVSNNILLNNRVRGIWIMGENSTFSSNVVIGLSQSNLGSIYGIQVGSNANYNVLTGNRVSGVDNPHISYFGYGLHIGSSDDVTVVGNTMLGNEVNFLDTGTNTVDVGNNYA